MGTVGLSFGTPTSGTGFDVSSTVAEIVGNLKQVETPWQTQLTTLESQDTVISNLGTLFSNLSNDMSSLTDFTGVMALKEGSSSDTNALTLTAADSTAVAGTHIVTVSNLAQTSSGYMTQIASASDTLSGSVTLQAGSGTQLTLTLNSSDNTLSTLAATINASAVGITASVLTDAQGSLLSLVSNTSGVGGNINVSTNSIVATSSSALAYTGTAGTDSQASTGALAGLANANDTLSGSMSIQVGSGTAETIVVGGVPSGGAAANTIYTGSGVNTLSGIEDAINAAGIGVTASVVNNSLSLLSNTAGSAGTLTVTSAMMDNTALNYTSAVAGADANLTVDGVALTSSSNTVANLIPGVTFQLLAPSTKESDGSLEQIQVVIGNDNTGVESTMVQMVSDYNSLISAINAQEGNDSSGKAEPLFGSPTLSLLQQQLLSGLNMQSPNGSLTSVPSNADTTLAGSISIQVGTGTANVITLSSDNTLAGLAAAINSANIGVTANVVTANGQSSLSLISHAEGASGALTVSSSIVATSATALSATVTDGTNASGGTAATASTAVLSAISSSGATLTGSISIQAGNGTAQTFTIDSSNNTLSTLATAINQAGIGVTASVVYDSNGAYLSLTSTNPGTAGDLTVTSNLLDTTDTTSTNLSYTSSSDISSLTTLGLSVNNDGSLSLDVATLDSLLNSDYSGAVGFFQNSNGWGQTFSTMLSNAGSSSATGILKLASRSNSNIESTLNADISREESQISAQQISLTNELNQANQIMQELPTQLEGVNELYSAITGYNQNTNG